MSVFGGVFSPMPFISAKFDYGFSSNPPNITASDVSVSGYTWEDMI